VSGARKSAAQASAAKQKKIAIGGAVLLVGVLVIQGPKMMKLLSGGSSSSSTPPAAVAPPVAPAATPGAPSATPVSAASEPTGTKFVSFETFSTKDPFAAQVDPNSAAAVAQSNSDETSGQTSPSGTSVPAGLAATAAPDTDGDESNEAAVPESSEKTTGTTGSGTTSTSTGTTAKPSFKVTGGSSTSSATATIAVNSKRQVVTVEHDFPESDPVFTLVTVGANSVSIGIAGGSLKTGGKTFTLSVGTPTTLLNTATGKKYKLELLSTAPSGT
jgi:hypothetical protein